MTNKPKQGKPRKRTDPLRDLLEDLVVPVFEELSFGDEDEREPVTINQDDGEFVLRGLECRRRR